MVSSDLSANDERAGTRDPKHRAVEKLLAIKSGGYLVSTLSVVLLGLVSWKKASEEPLLMVFLIAGMATSVIGSRSLPPI